MSLSPMWQEEHQQQESLLGKAVTFALRGADNKIRRVKGVVATVFTDGRIDNLEIELEEGGAIFLPSQEVQIVSGHTP